MYCRFFRYLHRIIISVLLEIIPRHIPRNILPCRLFTAGSRRSSNTIPPQLTRYAVVDVVRPGGQSGSWCGSSFVGEQRHIAADVHRLAFYILPGAAVGIHRLPTGIENGIPCLACLLGVLQRSICAELTLHIVRALSDSVQLRVGWLCGRSTIQIGLYFCFESSPMGQNVRRAHLVAVVHSVQLVSTAALAVPDVQPVGMGV